MYAVFGALHDWSNCLSKTVNLLPERFQTGHVIVKVYCGHVGTWVSLKNKCVEKRRCRVSFRTEKRNTELEADE